MDDPLFKVVNRLRKEGKLQEAWDVGCSGVQNSPQDSYLKGAFFWVCYDFLKIVHADIKNRAEKTGKDLSPTQSELDRINFLTDWIIWLNIPPGGFEYRSLLLVFQRYLDVIPKLVIVLANHFDSLFEPGDEQPFKNEKGESPSLMLKFARSLAKAWLAYREVQDISLDYVITILEKVRVNAQDVQHLMWLDYDEAKLLIVAGRNEEARKLIIPILKRKKSEPWAWGALAASYRKEDDNKAITLFSKGIICAHDEKFSLKLLKGIAPLLAKAGFDQEASMCVIRLLNWYESNGYKIKPDLESLANQPWFNSSVDVTSLNAFFEEKSAQALNLLNGPTKKKVGLVMSLHKSGKGLHLYLSETESVSVPLFCFGKHSNPKEGDYVQIEVPINDEEDRIISATIIKDANIPGVEVIEGNLRLSDKGFGFVDDTFISPDLLEPDMDGQHLKVMRVKGFDKKKNQPGWRAVKVELMKD
tara:strand:- start:26876 stop:28294 length:1419 start_codon:yes stop_codon:yes gene_type:complete